MATSPPYTAAVWFFSDIHLSENTPDITQAFLRAIARIAVAQPQSVYILGDLFDYWMGDDMVSPYQRMIAQHLTALANVCPVYYQHGNRDFLLGEDYARQSGMKLLPERHVMALGEHNILLEHGDLLCTDDIGYQRLRSIVRRPWLQALYRQMPRRIRMLIAEKLRRQSQKLGKQKASHITDVNTETVEHILHDYAVDTLIHGHTHRPAQHQQRNGKRYVLGDWHPDGIMLYYRQTFHTIDSSAL